MAGDTERGKGSDARESLGHLRLDKRLQKRRGWIEKADLEAELTKLPDVSDKILDEPAPAEAGSGAPASGASESDETPGFSGG